MMTMITYSYNDTVFEMRRFLSENFPDWGKATGEILLTVLSQSDNPRVKESAELIKISRKSKEMVMLLDFSLSMLRKNPIPIRESIYDTAIDGIQELNHYYINKYGYSQKDKDIANANNWLLWYLFRIPGKEELKRRMLIY